MTPANDGVAVLEPCEWRSDDEPDMGGAWHTACGEIFCITDGSPSDNGMIFCCYCGNGIMQTYAVADEAEDQ